MIRLIPLLLSGSLFFGVTNAPAAAFPYGEHASTGSLKAEKAGTLVIQDPWIREAPPGARVLGGYMILVNPSDRDDRLLSASSPLAGKIEIHRMAVSNGMMTMEAIPYLTVPANGEAKLQPGGNHLMIYDVKRDLKAGDHLPLELTFEHAGRRTLDVPVRKVMGKRHH